MEIQTLLKVISLLLQYPDEEIKSVDWKMEFVHIDEPGLFENMNAFGEYFQQEYKRLVMQSCKFCHHCSQQYIYMWLHMAANR